MEILFQNTYTRNKALLKEVYQLYYFKRKIIIALDIFFLLAFLGNLVIAVFEKTYNWEAWIVSLVFFFVQFFCYFRAVKTIIARDKELHGKEIEVQTVVTDEGIKITTSTGTTNHIDFAKIKKVYQTKNLILLQTQAKLVCIFRKESFSVGDKDSFLAFLRSKGISVKRN